MQNISDTITALILYDAPISFATLPFADSFEAGVFENWWRTSSTPGGQIQVQTSYVSDGMYSVLMDTNAGFALNELTLYLDLTGETDVWLSFQSRDFSDETHTMPATFSGSSSSDGVAVSTDGINWYRVFNLGPLLTENYQTFVYNLDIVNQTYGLTFGPSYQIKFTQYDNSSVAIDGIAYDDVRVTSVANDTTPPTGTATFSGSTTSVLAVSLNVAATDDTGLPVASMRFSNDGMNWSAWQNYESTRSLWDLSDPRFGGTTATGTKNIYAQFDDGRGNISAASTASIDYQPPSDICDITTTNTSLDVGGGESRVNLCRNSNCEFDQYVFDGYPNRFITGMPLNAFGQPGSVTVNMNSSQFDTNLYVYDITAGGCTLLGSNNDSGMSTNSEVTVSVVTSGSYWIVASSTASFSNGSYSVAASGQLTDTVPPTGTVSGPNAVLFGPLVELTLFASDTGGNNNAGSGVSDMQFSNDGMSFSAWVSYATSYSAWDITDSSYGGTSTQGRKTVYVRFRDGAGNVSISSLAYFTFEFPTAATLPFSDEFTSTSLGGSWRSASTGNGRIRVSSTNSPASTPYHVLMDSSSGYALNELVLCLDIAMENDVVLTYDTREFTDEGNTLPSSFVGSANGDGVAVSDDGLQWYRVDSLTALTSTYETRTVDLSQVISNNSNLSATSRFFIKFVQYDNNPIATDGIAFDNIVVSQGDRTAPTGTVIVDNGASSTSSLLVDLTLSATDNPGGTGVTDMRFSNDGMTWANWETYSTSRSNWDLSSNGGSSTAGNKTVYSQYRDAAGNISQTVNDSISFTPPDTTAPTGSLDINNGASSTSTPLVTLNLMATDEMGGSGLADMRFSNNGTSWTSWRAYSTTRTNWDLTDTNYGGTASAGTKQAYVQYRDNAGNVSTAYSDTITYTISDTSPPTGSIQIDGNNPSTAMLITTLTLSASDNMGGSGVSEMQFSNNGSNWTTWENYRTTRINWNLADSNTGGNSLAGTKTVYARFKDNAGNVSVPVSDTINYERLDTIPPTGSLQINNGASSTSNPIVTLNCNAQDEMGGSGVAEMQFSNDTMNWTAWTNYQTTQANWNFTDLSTGGMSGPGTRIVYAKYRDAAGNESSVYDAMIDYVPDDLEALSTPIDLFVTPASSSQIVLSWSPSTDNVAVAYYRVESRLDGIDFTVTATVGGTSFSHDGLEAETRYSYRIQAVDTAGNESDYSEVSSAVTLPNIPGLDAGFIDVGVGDAGIEPLEDAGTSTQTGSSRRRRTTRTSDDEGCSCQTQKKDSNQTGNLLVLLMVLGLIVGRKKSVTGR